VTRRLNAALLCVLLAAAPAWADDAKAAPPTLTIPPLVTPHGQYAQFLPEGNCVSVVYVGLDGVEPIPPVVLKDPRFFLLDTKGLAEGKYRFSGVGAGSDGAQVRTDFAVVVGSPPPGPTPGPGPGPTPPGPTPPGPTPGPAPIPGDGLRVLMVYESADLTSMPKDQLNAMRSAETVDYLNKTCPKGSDGKTPEWRCWDKDLSTANEDQVWQDAMKRPRASTPWIVVSNGKAGFEGKMPANQAEMTALLKKYGG